MTPERIELVRASWVAVRGRGDALATAFYAHLFQIAPQTRALFAKTDMTAQRSKFVDMLGQIVDSLSHPFALVNEVSSLGRRHVDYGVRSRDYPVVGDALLFALEQELGDAMSREVREAWREAYLLLAALMNRGADASQPPAPQ
jgi:nitric oxide dioxygenase